MLAQYIGCILGVGCVSIFYLSIIKEYEDEKGLDHCSDDSIGPLALYWADGMEEVKN